MFTLNLTHSMGPLSVFDTPPQEFLESGAVYRPESQASGGATFQRGRRYRACVYYANCVATETGVVSVGLEPSLLEPSISYGNAIRAALSYNCKACPSLVYYNDCTIQGYATTLKGTVFVTTEGKLVKVIDGVSSIIPVKGLDLSSSCLQGITAVEGHLLVYTPHTIYVASMADIDGDLDYTPKYEYGATSFSISADIGDIVHIIAQGRGIYVFGSKGAVYGACSGDITIPFVFNVVKGLSGIYSKRNVAISYEAIRFLIYTKSGLQQVTGTQAENIYPDWSNTLRNNSWSSLWLNGEECVCVNSIQPNNTVNYIKGEIVDSFNKGCYKPLYEESTGECSVNVAVNNLSPKYTTISYAIKDNECGPSYCRLAVIDNYHERATILHATHTDVLASYSPTTEFRLLCNRVLMDVRIGLGVGSLLFNDFSTIDRSSTVINGLTAVGKFNGDPPESIRFTTGIDVMASGNEHLHLVKNSTREVIYGGVFRYNIMSLLFPFRGSVQYITIGRH